MSVMLAEPHSSCCLNYYSSRPQGRIVLARPSPLRCLAHCSSSLHDVGPSAQLCLKGSTLSAILLLV